MTVHVLHAGDGHNLPDPSGRATAPSRCLPTRRVRQHLGRDRQHHRAHRARGHAQHHAPPPLPLTGPHTARRYRSARRDTYPRRANNLVWCSKCLGPSSSPPFRCDLRGPGPSSEGRPCRRRLDLVAQAALVVAAWTWLRRPPLSSPAWTWLLCPPLSSMTTAWDGTRTWALCAKEALLERRRSRKAHPERLDEARLAPFR
jgi:hypothetical protein